MANFIIPPHPLALPISRTCVYKTIEKTSIPIDIYVPRSSNGGTHPIMLFIHGGGWSGGNKTDYCRPLFHQFLSLGFVVTSMDYRLRPETSINGQLEDIRDVEHWLRNTLALEIRGSKMEIDVDKVIVVGASAGAHLALLTPKLWTILPIAILSMYGPTDMHSLPYLQRGRLSNLSILPCTPDVLAAATNYEAPPTEIAIPKSAQDYVRPRGIMSLNVFRKSIIAEFLLKGLVKQEDGTLKLPERGCVSKEQIDAISPLHLCKRFQYPPVYQVMGTTDEVFEVSHIHDFHSALQSLGIKTEKILVPNVGHSFDIWAEIGSEIHEDIIGPAVAWVAAVAGITST